MTQQQTMNKTMTTITISFLKYNLLIYIIFFCVSTCSICACGIKQSEATYTGMQCTFSMVQDIDGDNRVSGTNTADRPFSCLHLPSCQFSPGERLQRDVSENSLKPGRQSDAYLAIDDLDVATEHGADDAVDERVDD